MKLHLKWKFLNVWTSVETNGIKINLTSKVKTQFDYKMQEKS